MASRFSVVGFSGSRRLGALWAGSVWRVVSSVAPAACWVGDCAGLDALVRAVCPASRLRVFSVSQGAIRAAGRGAFAARSVRLVRAVGADVGAAFVAFVDRACPAGVFPGSSWSSGSSPSGSWSSAALAAGLGVPLFVFCCGPVGLPSWGGAWSFVAAGPFAGSWSFVSGQRSLF